MCPGSHCRTFGQQLATGHCSGTIVLYLQIHIIVYSKIDNLQIVCSQKVNKVYTYRGGSVHLSVHIFLSLKLW